MPLSSSRPALKTDRPLPVELAQKVLSLALDQMSDVSERQRVCVVFDGRKNAMTADGLPFDERTQQVELPLLARSSYAGARPARRRLFHVRIQLVNRFDSKIVHDFIRANRQAVQAAGSAFIDQLAIVLQALNIAFKADASRQYTPIGAGCRRFFDAKSARVISDGGEIWRGFFQSVRPVQAGLFLNLDVAFTCL